MRTNMPTARFSSFILATLFTASAIAGEPTSSKLSIHKVAEHPATEAHQAVAVDKKSFFAITNRAIGRYDKQTGERQAKWSAPAGSPVIHLNSGIVIDGKLYCANSNWPKSPLRNSVEVFDATSLEHLDRIEFSETRGAINWIDRRDGSWWIVFAYYATVVEKTRLVRYSDKWESMGQWNFPDTVLKRFSPNSNSGGAFGPRGRLFATGHDHAEMYVLELPKTPGVMKHLTTVAAPIAGQGIAFDPDNANRVYGIVRKKRIVVSMRLGE
ncbi:MAG: outer membrane protein assembly factor BamB [Pirellulaceae bacterium]|jgi:outer membrane protein assembly factor BamB